MGLIQGPMLRELRINLNLESRRASESGFSLCHPLSPTTLYFICLLYVFFFFYLLSDQDGNVDNQDHGKLVDDLSSTQLYLLVHVLYHLASKQVFKALLTPENIRDVINHPMILSPRRFWG